MTTIAYDGNPDFWETMRVQDLCTSELVGILIARVKLTNGLESPFTPMDMLIELQALIAAEISEREARYYFFPDDISREG